MDLLIRIGMDSEAFDDYPGYEVARILRHLASVYEDCGTIPEGHSRPIVDVNGNGIGYVCTESDITVRIR